jgi:hypothetical protein
MGLPMRGNVSQGGVGVTCVNEVVNEGGTRGGETGIVGGRWACQ